MTPGEIRQGVSLLTLRVLPEISFPVGSPQEGVPRLTPGDWRRHEQRSIHDHLQSADRPPRPGPGILDRWRAGGRHAHRLRGASDRAPGGVIASG
jgi:hypothetical protein